MPLEAVFGKLMAQAFFRPLILEGGCPILESRIPKGKGNCA